MQDQFPGIVVGNVSGEHLKVRVLSRCHPNESDYWDGNWVESEIQIKAGSFKGSYRADLRSEDFQNFNTELQTLEQKLKGAAHFKTMEDQLQFTLDGDGLGHIAVEGFAMDVAGTGNRLTFKFGIDQTYLSRILKDLERVLQEFPVIGNKTE